MYAIEERLIKFRQQYYLNQAIRGLLISLLFTLSFYLLFAILEYFGHFHSYIRAAFFFTLLFTLSFTLIYYCFRPLGAFLGFYQLIQLEDVARYIGKEIPEVADKLLNALQLKQRHGQDTPLLLAAIEQKEAQLRPISFYKALPIAETKKIARYSFLPLALLILILLTFPSLLLESSQRIARYKQHFPRPAPFSFILHNQTLTAFRGDNITLRLETKGRSLPAQMQIVLDQQLILPMKNVSAGLFEIQLSNLQESHRFYFQTGEYSSEEYRLSLKEKPIIISTKIEIQYPDYLGKNKDQFQNATNLVIPAGSQIFWYVQAKHTQAAKLKLAELEIDMDKHEKEGWKLSKRLLKSTKYQLQLHNADTILRSSFYQIDVVPDLAPQLDVRNFEDTLSYGFVGIFGSAQDDHGLAKAVFAYRHQKKGQSSPSSFQFVKLPLKAGNYSQLIYELDLKELDLKAGDLLEYFVQVWDNNQVNGPQYAKSPVFRFVIPEKKDIEKTLRQESQQTQQSLNIAIKKEKELNEELRRTQERLRLKKQFDFSDKKQIENLIQKKNEINDQIQHLQEEFYHLQDKINRFERPSEDLLQKMQELQKLMDELLDEETKRLYEELEKLLNEMTKENEILKKIEEMRQTEELLERNLERTLELFKQLQFEQKLENSLQKINELIEQQEMIRQQTQESKTKEDFAEQNKAQEDLRSEFEQLRKALQELHDMNQQLENPHRIPNTKTEEENIQESIQKSLDELQKRNRQKAIDEQQKSLQQMQQMHQKLQQMQQAMQQERMQENMQTLRNILDNTLRLSFEQEQLMEEMRNLTPQDPRYVDLTQRQYRIKENSQIIKDSLWALSKRVFQLQAFITEEIADMEKAIDYSLDWLKDRRVRQANASQQKAMTHMNNLALMLSDLLKQMQSPAGSGKGNSQSKQKNTPSMSELQRQLNQQIRELKDGQQQGRQLSEQLVKLAAQQELLRRKIEELQKSGQLTPEQKQMLDEVKKQMEETEKDLINKNLSQETLRRQKEIETRLLEAEKSLRERGEEEQRRGETAKPQPKRIPPAALQEYFQQKRQQIELIESVPPSMTPYYKQRTDEYFKQIKP